MFWSMKPLGVVVGAIVALTAFVGTPVKAEQSTLEQIQSRGSLRVGWAVLYPDFYQEPGTNEYKGMAYDIVQDLAKTLNVKLDLVQDNWSTLVAGLQANKFDVTIPSMGVTLPRVLAVSFSAPVYQAPIGLMIRKQDASKFNSIADFDNPNVRVSVTLGSNADMYLTRALPKAQILRVKAAPDTLTQILTGRADAWASPTTAFAPVAKEQPTLQPFDKGVVGFSPVSFAFRAGDYRFKEFLDAYVGELKNSGQLKKLFEKYGLTEENMPK